MQGEISRIEQKHKYCSLIFTGSGHLCPLLLKNAVMKKTVLLLFILIAGFLYGQVGFNKTYYICNGEAYAISNIVNINDSLYFVSGNSIYDNNKSGFNFFNINSNGDTFNVNLFKDSTYFFYLGYKGNLIKKSFNELYQCVISISHEDSLHFYAPFLMKFNGYDTVFTKIIKKDTLDFTPNDFTYLDGYFYYTGAIKLSSSSTYYSVMLAKTDSLGNLLWVKHYGNDKAVGYQIISTYDGNLLIGAEHYYPNAIYGNQDQSDWEIIKVDTSGTVLWDKRFGNDELNDGAPGYMLKTKDGNYIISGALGMFHSSPNPYFSDSKSKGRLVKIDGDGNIIWDKLYGYEATEATGSSIIKETPDGSLIAIMYTVVAPDSIYYSPSNPVMVSLTEDGKIKWFRQYYFNKSAPTSVYDESTVESLDFTSDGGYIFAGYGLDTALTPMQRGWIVKTDSLGFDGGSTYNADTLFRLEHAGDTCTGDTITVHVHIYGVCAPYKVEYEGYCTHDSLYYSPEFELYVKDSLLLSAAMFAPDDSIVNILCRVRDGIGRELADTITVNVSCLYNEAKDVAGNSSYLKVYPNPANDFMVVEYALTNAGEGCGLEIYDMRGNLVKSIPLNKSLDVIQINVNDIPSGNYVLKFCRGKYPELSKNISITH